MTWSAKVETQLRLRALLNVYFPLIRGSAEIGLSCDEKLSLRLGYLRSMSY